MNELTQNRNEAIKTAFIKNCISCKFSKPLLEKYPQVSMCKKWCETVEHFNEVCDKHTPREKPHGLTAQHLDYIIEKVCR